MFRLCIYYQLHEKPVTQRDEGLAPKQMYQCLHSYRLHYTLKQKKVVLLDKSVCHLMLVVAGDLVEYGSVWECLCVWSKHCEWLCVE